MVQSSTYLSACLSIHTWAIILNRNISKRYHNRWAATLAFWFHTWQDLGDISTGELQRSASILEFAISPCSWVNKESTSALLITGLITSTHRFGYNALRPWPTNTGNRGSLEARCFHLLLKVVECCWYSDYPHIHRGLRSMVDRVGRLRRVEAWKKKFSSIQMAFMPVLASWPIFIWHTFSRSIQRWVPYSCHFTKCWEMSLSFLPSFSFSTLRLLLGWPRFTRTMKPLKESSKSGTPKPLTTNFLIHFHCEYSRISLDFSRRWLSS